MNDIQQRAKELSLNFLENEKQYRLGFVDAEKSNPLTKNLGETFVADTTAGVKMLLSVDKALISPLTDAVFSNEFSEFYSDVIGTLKGGGRIIISGCGSTGRLAMRIEASWRQAIAAILDKAPELSEYADRIIEVMTGGDFAVIRSVESFEDYAVLGAMQVRELGITDKDLLIGVTATAETTSILGSAKEALALGARVWMIVCTDPALVRKRLARAEEVFSNERTKSIYIKCGPFAVSGSSRMQSSTSEQLIISLALEAALSELMGERVSLRERQEDFILGFKECIALLTDEKSIALMSEAVDKESKLYGRGGYVTYFADDYILDVLTDTTERSPTFTTPPFRPQKRKGETLSWAFVKNPSLKTPDAWDACFARTPRCIDKTHEEYLALGVKSDDVKRIPKISLDAILEYEIGQECDSEREGEGNLAVWIDFIKSPKPEYFEASKRYGESLELVLSQDREFPYATRLMIFEHIAVKLMLNTLSTGTMAKMGRVRGNYMVHLNISNKKLIDRATRIISELAGVSYEEANYELFLTKLDFDARGVDKSTTIATLERLTNKKEG